MKDGNLVFVPPNGKQLVLASASPRRRELLEQLGLEGFGVEPPGVDERINKGEIPREYALRMALEKVASIRQKNIDSYVLGADTVVACGRRVVDKANTRKQAEYCLKTLSGRSHKVVSALVVGAPNGKWVERTVTTTVTFKRLQYLEINNYLDSAEWEGKAGGYGIQGLASAFVKKLNGSYTNVVGLPLHEVYTVLLGLGFHYLKESGRDRSSGD